MYDLVCSSSISHWKWHNCCIQSCGPFWHTDIDCYRIRRSPDYLVGGNDDLFTQPFSKGQGITKPQIYSKYTTIEEQVIPTVIIYSKLPFGLLMLNQWFIWIRSQVRGTHATLENLIGPYVCLKIKSLIVRYRITLDCEPSSDEARLHESCLELSLSTEGRFLQPGFSLFSHNFIDSFLDSCLNCFASFRRSSHRSSRNSYPPQKFMSMLREPIAID